MTDEWTWDKVQRDAFNDFKKMLKSDVILKLYDPNRDTVVTTDSSSYGHGAVLMQKKDGGLLGPSCICLVPRLLQSSPAQLLKGHQL